VPERSIALLKGAATKNIFLVRNIYDLIVSMHGHLAKDADASIGRDDDATAAVQKYHANKKSVETAEKAYDFARKRYDLSLLSTYELLITQNTLQSAKTQLLYAQYDYVFKMKLLEFYKGQGIKL